MKTIKKNYVIYRNDELESKIERATFISTATYKESDDHTVSEVTVDTKKITLVNITDHKILNTSFVANTIIECNTATQWRFYGDKYSDVSDSHYHLYDINGCMDFINGIIATIEVAKKHLTNKDEDFYDHEYLKDFVDQFSNKFVIESISEEELDKLLE